MNKYIKGLIILNILVLLSGCWDERQFKNIKIVLAGGFDVVEQGEKIRSTVVIPTVEKGLEGPGNEYIQVVSSIADTPREGRSLIDQKISKNFDSSKIRVLLLGEEMARQDILPLLDVMYRDPKSNLNAKLAVVKGTAEEVLRLRIDYEPRISGYINGLLEGQIRTTLSPKENIQLICAELLSEGQDFVLPLLSVNENEGKLNYNGLALFHEQSYTGKSLNQDEALMLMLMDGKKGDVARITKKIETNNKQSIKNFITIDVSDVKSKIKIKTKPNLQVDLKIDLVTDIIEYPKDNLNAKLIKELEKKLSKIVTEEAENVLNKLQEANSDVLGIGRRMIAYHYKEWQKLDWKEAYPEITITPTVKVKIEQHGIIN